MIRKYWTFIAHIELLYSYGEIRNETFDNGTETSADYFEKTPDQAYYSKNGEEKKLPDWDKILNKWTSGLE